MRRKREGPILPGSRVGGFTGDREMQKRWRTAVFASIKASAKAVVMIALFTIMLANVGHAQAYKAPRTADGKPDWNGIWEALNTANWDLQDHAAEMASVVALGPACTIPAGAGWREG